MGNIVYETVLASYKRANKEVKQRMLKKYGFSSEQDFFKFLGGPAEVTTAPAKGTKKSRRGVKVEVKVQITPEVLPTIHNVHILDVSGSMDSHNKIGAALEGINAEIDGLKSNTDAKFTHSFVTFSDPYNIKASMWKIPMASVGKVHEVAMGCTALHQAVGETLERLVREHNGVDKVLVKIFTDGGENASTGKYQPRHVISQFIKECEAKGFTITFVGTKNDVDYAVNNLSMDASNTLVHDNTFRGIKMSSHERLGATIQYAKKARRGEDVTKGFFKEKGKLQ